MPEQPEPSAAADSDAKPDSKSRRPKDSRFLQQNLPACRPVLEPTWVVFIFLAIAVVCIPIGVVCLIYGLEPVELTMRYDNACLPNMDNAARENHLWANAGSPQGLSCEVTLTVEDTMSPPIYVFYEIRNMYQNHRRYVRSRSDRQLVNDTFEGSSVECDPQEEYQGDSAKPPISPCGLTAWSYFNDTYTFRVSRQGVSQNLTVSDQGIIFPSDKKLFADYLPSNFNPQINEFRGGDNITGEVGKDERFINWMRLAPLPTFRKLWGKIEGVELKLGDNITIKLINQYNSYGFDGEKHIVLGTTSWLGGKNPFLGITYLVTGGISVLMCCVYLVVLVMRPRKFGDVSLVSMPSQATGVGRT